MKSMKSMNEQFMSTIKSTEISSWFEINVMRRTGFYLAYFANKLDMHPNTITIMSMILGAGSAYFFASGSWYYGFGEQCDKVMGVLFNVIAVGMLFWADVLDNTDGQLARLSGKRSRIGRILDGMAGFVWMIPIYLVLIYRMYLHHDLEFSLLGIENNETNTLIFTGLVTLLVFHSGFAGCGAQQRVSDYYVQAHLLFANASNGSEFDNSVQQQQAYENLPKDASWFERLFMKTYVSYTRRQESQTPKFQALLAKLHDKYGSVGNMPDDVREELRAYSLPIIRMDYIGFAYRAVSLAVFVLLDVPLLHFLFETFVLGYATHYTIRKHEAFCEKVTKKL